MNIYDLMMIGWLGFCAYACFYGFGLLFGLRQRWMTNWQAEQGLLNEWKRERDVRYKEYVYKAGTQL